MGRSTDDTLLQCLLALCRYHGSASTPDTLLGGLPLDKGILTPGLFERAAARVGLSSRVISREARTIEPALLPAVPPVAEAVSARLRLSRSQRRLSLQ